jgi:hypothetical protein
LTKRFLIGLFCLLTLNGLAQNWDWAKELTGDKSNYFVDISTFGQTIYAIGNFGDSIQFANATFINPISPTTDKFVSSVFINAIQPSGNVIWNKILYGNNVKASSIFRFKNRIYASGNYIDTLFVDNDTLISPYISIGMNESIYLICMDTLGNTIYVKDYGYSKGYYPDALMVNDSGIYMSGVFNEYIFYANDTIAPTAFPDLFFSKMDLNGNRLWTNYGNYYINKRYKRKSYLLYDSNYNVYLTGHYKGFFTYNSSTVNGSNVFVLKTNPSGNFISLNNFCTGDSIEIFDAVRINDTLYFSGSSLSDIVLGQDTILTPFGTQRAFLTKTDTGFSAYTNILVSEQNTKGNCLSLDPSNNIYWSVQFDTALTILGQNITNTFLPNFNNHAISKITNFNQLRYEHLISGKEYFPYAADVDKMGNYYIAGFNNNIQHYDTNLFSLNGNLDGFLAKIACTPNAPQIFSNDTTICWNEQKEIWINNAPYLTPLWQNNSTDTLISINQPGTYYCQIYDENGCKSDTSTISVIGFPRTSIAIDQICDSLFVNYPSNGEWWFNDTLIGISNNLIANENGWYSYQNIDTNGCATIDSIFLNKQPYLLELEQTCDSLSSLGANGQVIWYQNNIIVDTAYFYIVSQSGDYFYTYTDSIGCQWSSDTITLDVSRFSEILEVFPNPVQSNLYVKGLYQGTVKIFDMTGRLENTWTFDSEEKNSSRCKSSNHQIPIDLSSLAKGLHFIQIESKGFIWSDKIIKQ